MSSLVYIDEKRVKSLLNWNDTFVAVEKALSASNNDEKSSQTLRSTIKIVNDNEDVLLTMPGHLKDDKYGALCCKFITSFEDNSKKNLPNVLANIVLLDEETGKFKAIIEATEITEWRTAAASAVATKHLHLNKSDGGKNILAIFGAGAQGKAHAIAFQHFFHFKEVRIWNRTKERADNLVKELNRNTNNSGIFRLCENIEDCANNADVIVTATSSTEPLIKSNHLKRNVHINAIGAGRKNIQELDVDVYRKSEIYCDYLDGTKREFANLERQGIKFEHVVGDVIDGNIKSTNDKTQITIFQSIGMAIEDCAMARLIYDLHQT